MTSQFDKGPKTMSYKQVAKWIKSKGRGKLRNYCTMCSRQFRDKKGLKNHMGSKSHLEKMRDFNENPDHYLQKFSDDFEQGFLNILKRMYIGRFVFARTVYTEYCHILHHRHLNSTFWETLDDFILHLESKKICEVKKAEKGYFIKYIPQGDDLEILRAQEKKKKKKKRIETDEEAHLRIMNEQMKEANKKKKMKKNEISEPPSSSIFLENSNNNNNNNEIIIGKKDLPPKIIINQNQNKNKNPKLFSLDGLRQKKMNNIFIIDDNLTPKKRKREEEKEENNKNKNIPFEPSKKKQKISNKKNKKNKEGWLIPGIIVKIRNKKLENGEYHLKKAKVLRTDGKKKEFGILEILMNKDQIKINQRYLETVIPKLDSEVMILKDDLDMEIKKGDSGILKKLKKKKFCGVIQVFNKNNKDLRLIDLEYEYFSKKSK